MENVARALRRVANLFKQISTSSPAGKNPSLTLSSCFDIRSLRKGLVIYQNTFQNVYATTGAALHLYGFYNTLSYPVIVDSNVITNNFVQDYGAAFYIGKTGTDYSKLGCDGIFIYNNTISNNLGCPYTVGTALVLCDTDIMDPMYMVNSTGNIFLPIFDDSFYYQILRNQKGDYEPYTQNISRNLFNTLKNNKTTQYAVLHPFRTGFAIITNGITVKNNTFSGNQAWLSTGIIIQGAYNVTVDQNIFVNGTTFTVDSLNSPAWTGSPMVSILGVYLNASISIMNLYPYHTSQSPLWIKLADLVTITNCLFDSNAGASFGDYWLGSSITLHKMIGMNTPLIHNCTFQNHSGLWNLSTVAFEALNDTDGPFPDVDTLVQSYPFLEQFFTQNNAPLITVNFYEGTFDFNYTNNPNSQSTYHETPITNSTIIIDSCIFQNNVFNQTTWNYPDPDGSGYGNWWDTYSLYANQSFIVKGFVVNETIEYASYLLGTTDALLASNFYSYYNRIGRPSHKLTLITQNCQFTNNSVYSGQPLFANTIFDSLVITNSIFIGNTIASVDDSTVMNSNTAFFVARNDSLYHTTKPYINMSLTSLTFVNNSGSIFLSNYSTVNAFDAKNTLFNFNNLNISGHVSHYPLFYVGSSVKVQTNSLYLTNITTITPAFFIENVQDLTLQNITIDGINNFQAILNTSNDSSTNFQALNGFSLCLGLLSTTNVAITNFSCLNPTFEGNSFYAGTQIGVCGSLNKAYSTVFTNFSCIGASYLQNSYIQQHALMLVNNALSLSKSPVIQNSSFISNNAYQGILIDESYLDISSNTVFQNNNFQIYGLSGTVRSQIIFSSVTFQNNRGTLIQNEDGNTTFMFANFTNNTAAANTLLDISFGTVSITNCSFIQNNATEGALTSIDNANIQIVDTTFQHSSTLQMVLSLDQSELVLSGSQFINNYGKLTTPNIEIYQGSALIDNILFVGVYDWTLTDSVWKVLLADFLVSSGSNISITGLNATGARASNGVIYLEEGLSTQIIQDSTFSNGYGIYSAAISSSTPISVKFSNFTNNSGTQQASSILASSASYLSVYRVNINDAGGGAIYVSGTSYASISSVNITGSSRQTVQGGIQLDSFLQASISDVTVQNMNFTQGGGLSMVSTIGQLSKLTIAGLTIRDCSAANGGAISVVNVYTISLTDSTFSNNIANAAGGYGGAIYYNVNSSSASLTINSNVNFINNSASSAGGAIYYNAQPVQPGSGTFVNNSAVYGDNIGSYGVQFSITNVSTAFLLEFLQYYDPYSSYISQLESSSSRMLSSYEITSGVTIFPPIVFGIYDDNGLLVASDNSSTLSVSVNDGENATLLENSTFTAFEGYFILYPFSVAVKPNSTFGLSFQSPSIDAKLSSISRADPPNPKISLNLPFDSVSCPLGDKVGSNNECTTCPSGYYITIINSYDDCQNCPASQAVCDGGSVVGPTVGYWRLGSLYDTFYACKNDEACLGYSITDPATLQTAYCQEQYNTTFCLTGWCSERYQGNLCSQCRGNYARSSDNDDTCGTCNKNWWLYTSVVLFCLAAIAVVMVLVRSAILDEDTYIEKKRKELEERFKRGALNKQRSRRSSSYRGSRLRSREGSILGIAGFDPKKRDHSPSKGLEKRYSRGMNSFETEAGRVGNARPSLSYEQPISPTATLGRNDQSDKHAMSPTAQQDLENNSGPAVLGFAPNYQDNKGDLSPQSAHDVSKVVNLGNDYFHRVEKENLSKDATPNSYDASQANLVQSRAENKDFNFSAFTDNKNQGDHDSKIQDHESKIQEHELKYTQTLNKSSIFNKRANQFDAAYGDEDEEIDDILDSEEEEGTANHKDAQKNLGGSMDMSLKHEDQPAKLNLSAQQDQKHDQDGQQIDSPRSALSSQPNVRSDHGHRDSTVIQFGEKRYTKEEILDHHAKKINILSIFLKILINYVQLVSILDTFQLDWPSELETLFNINVSINLAFIDVFSVDCLFKNTFITNDWGMPTYFVKVLVYSLIPIILSIIGAIFWSISYLVKVRKEKTRKQQFLERTKARIIVTSIVICFFMHSSLMQLTISSLKCVDLGGTTNPVSYLDEDLTIECWGPTHKKWFYSITLPSLILWGLIVPVLALNRLFKYREKLNTYRIKSRYGWLYEGLKEKNYYWEFVITYRKILLILLSVFLTNLGQTIAANAILSVMIASFFFHAFQNPYSAKVLNRLENISLFSNTLVAYCALFFINGSVGSLTRLALFAVLCISFCAFMGLWLYYLIREQSRLLLKIRWFERHFGRCLRKLASNTNDGTADSLRFSKMQSGTRTGSFGPRMQSMDAGSELSSLSNQNSKTFRKYSTGGISIAGLIPSPNNGSQNDSMNSDVSPILGGSPQPIKRSRFYNVKVATGGVPENPLDGLAQLGRKTSKLPSHKFAPEDQATDNAKTIELEDGRHSLAKKGVKSIMASAKSIKENNENIQEPKDAAQETKNEENSGHKGDEESSIKAESEEKLQSNRRTSSKSAIQSQRNMKYFEREGEKSENVVQSKENI